MKRMYEEPEVEVVNLEVEDIITTSSSVEEYSDLGNI